MEEKIQKEKSSTIWDYLKDTLVENLVFISCVAWIFKDIGK